MTELQAVNWPTFTGLGGLSAVAGAVSADRTGARAAEAARGWSSTRPPMSFPFQETIEHFGAVGRMHVGESVLLPLRAAAATEVARDRWPLPLWLPSTVDQSTSTYDGYLLTDLLLSVVDLDEEYSVTHMLVGLTADLLGSEAAMLRVAPERQQRARTAAVAAVLSRLCMSDVGDAAQRLRAASDIVFADFAADFAASTLAPLHPDLALAVWIGHLPITPLHDEHMFLRCAQLLEVLCSYLGRKLQVVSQALRRGDTLVAVEEIERAISRARLSRPLYRVLTTMHPGSLEIIRAHSGGRSAVPSRLYRRIELICSARPVNPHAENLPPDSLRGPVLQEAFRAVAHALEPSMTALLVDRMTALDEAWCTM